MRNVSIRILSVFTVTLSLVMTSCGGGSGSGDPVVNPILVGRFVDSPVQGLSFRTATQSGVTDAEGTYLYMAGETITFSIGDTIFGNPVTATSSMTPRDLVTGAPLYTTAAGIQRARLRPKSAETLAFLRFVGILIFLQSLDEDADPANGITINAGIAGLLDGIQIDFDEDVRKLYSPTEARYWRGGGALRRVLHQASKMGYVSTAAPKQVGRAMDHFYSGQGIGTSVARRTAEEVDLNAATDPGVNETVSYEYDADGNRTSERHDADGDGVADTVRTYTYDAAGNVTGWSEDYRGDGTVDEAWTYTYDANGNEVESTWQFLDSSGSVTWLQTWTYEYDDSGNLVNGSAIGPFDEEYWTDSYDFDGNLVMRVWSDGAINVATDYLHDANGRLVGSATDYGADGFVDQTDTFTYDADGNRTMASRDGDADGTADRITTTAYNADGNPTSEEFDNDGDGFADATSTYTYDADGNLVSERHDFDADGNADQTTTYGYDANGDRVDESTDTDGDGVTDYTVAYSYDNDGNLVTESSDTDSDGSVDQVKTYAYEAGSWQSIRPDLAELFQP